MENSYLEERREVVIIGAGPAGLSAAYNILKKNKNLKITIIDEEPAAGGIARTRYKDGNGTDIGPHRFFTKSDRVKKLWNELLLPQGTSAIDDVILNRKFQPELNGVNPEEEDKVFLKRKRFSRIYYNGKFFDYPIKLNSTTLFLLGLKKSFMMGLSYLKACFFKKQENNLEDFMINRFGKVLYETFFRDYTEKVWGLSPSQISKEWGEQRIKGISLRRVLIKALSNHSTETSMIDEYFYPKYGASQLWNEMVQRISDWGGVMLFNSRVVGLKKSDNKIVSVTVKNTETGELSEVKGDIFLSSMPVKELLTEMNEVPEGIIDIAEKLEYRDFILVNFVTKNFNLKNNTNYPTINNIAPDSWIYLQDSDISAGRLDIMNSFSPYIVKNFKEDVVFNLEYFCNENDDFWKKDDKEILEYAILELEKHNITRRQDLTHSEVIRVKKAYPSYFGSYEKFEILKNYMNEIDNLLCIGRNGQHKYNNMDHSILSGIVAADVILGNSNKSFLWEVNTEKKYHEVK